MYKFCKAVIAIFGTIYLKEPTVEDTAMLLSINEERGFLGMYQLHALGVEELPICIARPV
jgi:hypothetical protein